MSNLNLDVSLNLTHYFPTQIPYPALFAHFLLFKPRIFFTGWFKFQLKRAETLNSDKRAKNLKTMGN